jgi:hypothetical protein
MSIDNLRLNPLSIVHLFEKNLVVTTSSNTITKKIEKQFLGNNSKNITIIVNYENATFISDEDLGFLTNILNACTLSMDNIAIINTKNSNINWSNVVDITNPNQLLFFGVSPTDFGMPILFSEYHIQNYNNVNCLLADNISKINMDKNLKTSLWTCLKKLFNI